MRRVEYFVRDDDGAWQPPVVAINDDADLFELGFTLSLATIYRRTSLADSA